MFSEVHIISSRDDLYDYCYFIEVINRFSMNTTKNSVAFKMLINIFNSCSYTINITIKIFIFIC